jgi:hypothetical protein
MIHRYRTLVKLCLVSAVFWGLLSNATAQEPSNLSGTVTVTATSAALGVGWSWGKGTLTLHNGKQGLDHGVGHFPLLSTTQQRHLLAYHFIAMRHEGLCQVF